MPFESFIDFFLRNRFVITFYVALFFLVYLNRKKFEIHLKFIALYKTQWGISLMDKIASRYGELVKLFGLIGIGVGFVGMGLIVFLILRGLFVLFTDSDAPASVAPILPGVHVPGVAPEFFIPLASGLIAIFVIATIHEFAHGVVARAHKITVKSSGPAIIGPFFAAFVEPDEKQIVKMPDVAQYSVYAAGAFSNILTALVVILLMFYVVPPAISAVYEPTGVSFPQITPGSPADIAGLETDVIYTIIDNQTVVNTADTFDALSDMQINKTVIIGNSQSSYQVIPAPRIENPERAYIGVNIINRFNGDDGASYAVVSWFVRLFSLIGGLSLAIGLANMLPIGFLDGGKMLQLALHRTKGKEKGNRTLVKVSLLLLIVILLLLTPIFRATFSAILGAF